MDKKRFLVRHRFLLFFFLIALLLSYSASAIDFKFSGFIQNTSYANVSGVNVTGTSWSITPGSPPTTTVINSTLTGSAGNFTIVISDPAGNAQTTYTLRAIQYNISNSTSEYNRSAIAINPELPPLPPSVYNELNGTTIFIQEAATINITAYVNNTPTNRTNFSGMVMDDKLGMPMEGAFFQNVFEKSMVVPRNRNYTVVLMSGDFSTPPIGFSVYDRNLSEPSHQTALNTFYLRGNITTTLQRVNGSFSVFDTNTTAINVTDVILYTGFGKLVPMMMPPMNVRNQLHNLELGIVGYHLYGDQTNQSYNMSVVASQAGVTYLLGVFGRNGSNGAPGTAYYAGFQNFTATSSGSITGLNVRLYELAGNYSTSSFTTDVSTARTLVSVRDNSTGGQGAADAGGFAELAVTYQNQNGDVPLRILSDISSSDGGSLRIPLLWINKSANIQNNVTLQIFNGRFAPLRTKLNLSINNITVNMKSFEMKRQRGTAGTFEHFSDADDAATKMFFTKNQAGCNVFNPPATCRVGGEFGGNFNPLTMSVAGKINIYINMSSTIIHFIGVDMLGSGPPDAIISDEPNQDFTSGENRNQIFRFGSLAPDIYDRVLIGIPYDENKLDESGFINITFDTLLDENQNLLWNGSQFPNGTSIPSRYSDYPANITNATAGGLRCYNVSSATCYINTTMNMLWLDLPHFDGGDIKAGGGNSAPSGGGGGGGGGGGAGSGGGGGGGAAASTAAGIKYSRVWPSLEPGAATVEVKKEGIGVTEIVVNVQNPVKNVQITVTKLDKAPADVSTPADSKIYQYIEIEKFNFKEADLGSSTLSFKVTKDWLTNNNVDEDSVVMLRLVNKVWTELSTRKLGSDNLAVSYTAETPGFSTFAIASKAIAAAPAVNETAEAPAAQPAQEVKPAEVGRQLPEIFGNVYFWLIIAVVIAVIAFLAFQQKGQQSGKK